MTAPARTLTDADVEALAERIAAKLRERRTKPRAEAVEVSETERAHVRRMAGRWGLHVARKR